VCVDTRGIRGSPRQGLASATFGFFIGFVVFVALAIVSVGLSERLYTNQPTSAPDAVPTDD